MKITQDEGLGLALAAVGLIALLLLAPLLGEQGGPPPLRVVFGWGAVVLAPALALGGVLIAFSGRMGWQVRWPAIALLEGLFWAGLTIAHLYQPDPLAAALAGQGGGVVGWATAQALVDVFGPAAARLIAPLGTLVLLAFFWRTLPPSWTAPILQEVVAGWGAVLRRLRSRPPARGVTDVLAGAGGAIRGAGTLLDGWRDRAAALLTRGAGLMQRLRGLLPGRGSADLPADRGAGQAAPRPRRARAPGDASDAARPSSRPAGPAATSEPQRAKGRGRTSGRPSWLPPYSLLRLDDGPSSSGGVGGSADARQRGTRHPAMACAGRCHAAHLGGG